MATAKRPLPNEVVLTIAEDGSTPEKLVVCLTQNDFNSTSNLVTTETFCGTENLPGSLGQTLNVALRRIWAPATEETSEELLYTWWYNKTHVNVTHGPKTPVTDDLVYAGSGYITTYNSTNGANTAPLANLVIQLDAPMVLTKTI